MIPLTSVWKGFEFGSLYKALALAFPFIQRENQPWMANFADCKFFAADTLGAVEHHI